MVVLRKPIGCDEYIDRKDLIRICKTNDGQISIDNNYNLKGRGCYIKKDINLFKTIEKKRLINKALRCQVDEEIYEKIKMMII